MIPCVFLHGLDGFIFIYSVEEKKTVSKPLTGAVYVSHLMTHLSIRQLLGSCAEDHMNDEEGKSSTFKLKFN